MKFLTVFCLFCVIFLTAAKPDYEKKYKQFQAKFSKKNGSCKEKNERAMKNFMRKVDQIEAHNEKFANGEIDYEMDYYDFDDEDPEEVIKQKCGTQMPPTARQLSSTTIPNFPAGPVSKDWRSFLQPVIDQGTCGSCWACASIAQLEFVFKRQNPAFNTPLSIQQLVDCSRNGINSGCGGGWPKLALDYVKTNGVVANSACPYRGIQASCRTYTKLTNKITQTYQYDLMGDEVRAKNLLASEGPVAIAVSVNDRFTNYRSGIFYDSLCPRSCSSVNHAVVLVGYGTEAGKDFWIVRNSWGPNWGEQGYIRMARNRGNNCLTACSVIYSK